MILKTFQITKFVMEMQLDVKFNPALKAMNKNVKK